MKKNLAIQWAAIEEAVIKVDDKKILEFKKKYPTLKVVRARGHVAESILEHSKKFDLIVITAKPKTKASLGRVAGKVVRSGDVPILIIP